jgi:LCP family protein required for cell wall assembly
MNEYQTTSSIKRKRAKSVFTLFILLILLLAMLLLAFVAWRIDQIPRVQIDVATLERVPVSGPTTNIAILGLDTRPGDVLGTRADTIMIASFNNLTGALQMISVYRDTVMLQQGGSYDKAAHAYALGNAQGEGQGAAQTVAMLNRNLDLNIEYFVAVDFGAVASVIDVIGGVELMLTDEEIYWTNIIAHDTALNIDRVITPAIEGGAGVHTLDGIYAVSFTRMRQTEGGDFRRGERQREVFDQIIQGVSNATPMQLLRIQEEILPNTVTNMSTGQILWRGVNLIRMNLGGMSGYPFEVTTGSIPGSDASYVIPINTSENVRRLHQVLFGNDNFIPSTRVQTISEEISNMTGVW